MSERTLSFPIGSLVRTRGREWVVLPESEQDLLMLRPLGGSDEEIAGVYLPLETVEPAQFELPQPSANVMGDFVSSKLLRDAVRLSARSGAGPFRSFGRIAVEPRSYQLVPLLMALRQDPIRLLIADDVGIGKTIEAALIARELLDRGEIQRMAVLCPPQLAEQWQIELRDKFHIDATLVLPSTAARLERNLKVGETLFDTHPHVIVSADFIKSDRRRDDFARTCPELVIVDEAHTFAEAYEGRGGRHQRHQLLRSLTQKASRHLILVTATPHSGNESAFRSLLQLLNPEFANLPDELGGRENEKIRRELARYFVQRKRGDIKRYLEEDTVFPERESSEAPYMLSPEYKAFFDKVLRYAREVVTDKTGNTRQQRIRWWSMLALLRALASSPAAAASTLRNRAAASQPTTDEQVDEVGRRTVLDRVEDESSEGIDLVPGSDFTDSSDEIDAAATPEANLPISTRRLRELANEAAALSGAADKKLQALVKTVKELLGEGYSPIVFCRFIETANYVALRLRDALPKVKVAAVTGYLSPEARQASVQTLAEYGKRVLVATDCLSEGINLQDHFDAVIHYDLSWNPTRHEQREGRVDRYRQSKPKVKLITFYGKDNQIDGVVLEVLIRKHNTIRTSLGISVPVPMNADQVVEAIFEGLLLRGADRTGGAQMALFEDLLQPNQKALLARWDLDAEREKQSRTMFAQHTIKPDEVLPDLRAARSAVGGSAVVEQFVLRALVGHNALVTTKTNGATEIDLSNAPRGLRDVMQVLDAKLKFKVRFSPTIEDDEIYLSRTHPMVEGLATYVMDTALDPLGKAIARRCAAMRTAEVTTRTTVLLLRYRHHLYPSNKAAQTLLAEECHLLAFEGAPDNARWLDDAQALKLLEATPAGNNVPAETAASFVERVVQGYEALRPYIETVAQQRATALLEAHERVRAAANTAGSRISRAEPQLPVDVLGIYVLLPRLAA